MSAGIKAKLASMMKMPKMKRISMPRVGKPKMGGSLKAKLMPQARLIKMSAKRFSV